MRFSRVRGKMCDKSECLPRLDADEDGKRKTKEDGEKREERHGTIPSPAFLLCSWK